MKSLGWCTICCRQIFTALFIVVAAVASYAAIADGSTKFLGNITQGTPASNYADYWNQITLENGGKWGSVQSSQNSFNWRETDAAYEYCKNKGWPYKHHCFVWGSQQPGWVNSGNARTAVENYIKTFGERYPETALIDVVNEPLHAPAGYREGLGGNGTTGWDWVVTVFELARKYCPNSKLILNDYGIVNDTRQTANYLKIIRILQERELIDMIGVQSHYFNLENVDPKTIKRNLDSLANTGLPITSSEFDLRGDENTQLTRYKTYFPIFWEHPAVVGVTLWGWTNNWGGAIIMSGGREYSALKWLRTYVDSLEKVTAIVPSKNRGVAAAPVSISLSGKNSIRINCATPQEATVMIVDPKGSTLVKTAPQMISGQHTVRWPAASVCSGIYIVMVDGKKSRTVKKFIR